MRRAREYLRRRGKCRRLATVLTIAVAARLAGAHEVTAIAEFVARLTQRQLSAVRALDFDAASSRTTTEKVHGRIEERECAVVSLEDFPDTIAPLPGRRQVFRVIRKRTVLSTGRSRIEAAYGLTSPDTQQAEPSEILAPNRGHREINNRLHYVRDVAFNEDHSRVRVGHALRNLACLSNATISLVRIRRRFQHQPQAHRHYVARHTEALDEVPWADT